MSPAERTARAWLAWINDAPAEHPEAGLALLTDDFLWHECPTRFGRRGRSGDARVLLDALAQAAATIDGERIALRRVICGADSVVLEVEWTGRLRATGADLRADGVMVLELDGDRIRSSRDYLCFDG